jgi:hypothetical protein
MIFCATILFQLMNRVVAAVMSNSGTLLVLVTYSPGARFINCHGAFHAAQFIREGIIFEGFSFRFLGYFFQFPALHAQTGPTRRDVKVKPNATRSAPAPVSQWPVESNQFALIVGVDQCSEVMKSIESEVDNFLV